MTMLLRNCQFGLNQPTSFHFINQLVKFISGGLKMKIKLNVDLNADIRTIKYADWSTELHP